MSVTHFNSLDSYRSGDSVLHRFDPRVKLSLTLAFIVAVSLTPVGAWPAYVLLGVLTFSAALASELGLSFVLKRSLLALPFVLAALPMLVTTRGQSVFSVALDRWTVTVTGYGLERFVSTVLKSWLSVQMAVVLTATTTLPDLLLAMRALHVPRLLVAMIGLMWRYLFVLADETMRLMRAREARSGAVSEHSGGTLAWRAHVTGSMAGTLFLRGYERSERIYNAMLSRGYDGSIRSFPLPPMERRESALLILGVLVLVGILLVGRLIG